MKPARAASSVPRRVRAKPDEAVSAPLVQHTLRQLLRDILAGVYGPGARIREAEVALRMGVSRAPVREALRVLEQDGLVEHLPFRGAQVVNPTAAEIADIFDLLAVACGAVARLAVRHASDAALRAHARDVDVLERRIEDGQGGADVIEASYRAGGRLADSCGSRHAAAMQRRLGRVAYLLHRHLLPAPRRWQLQSLSRHRKLVAALAARSEPRAEKAARRIVEHTRRRVLKNVGTADARRRSRPGVS
jgi:DNA-binding GntR family transcriptional regulator